MDDLEQALEELDQQIAHRAAVQREFENPLIFEVFCQDCTVYAEVRLDCGTSLCVPCAAQRAVYVPDLRARKLGTVELADISPHWIDLEGDENCQGTDENCHQENPGTCVVFSECCACLSEILGTCRTDENCHLRAVRP